MKNQNNCFRYLSLGLPGDVARCKARGDFAQALALIDGRLADGALPDALRLNLTAQREMIVRLPGEYPYDRAAALSRIRQSIPDFTEAEFDRRVAEGKIYWIYDQGEKRFFGRFFESMCKAEPAFALRAGVKLPGVESAVKGSGGDDRLDIAAKKLRENGSLSNRIRIRAAVRLKDEHFEKGMLLWVHLPIPCACEEQREITILDMTAGGRPAPVDAAQRTVFWEERMDENHEFFVEYSYVRTSIYHDTDTMRPSPAQPSFDTEEIAPHAVFSPLVRAVTAELTEGISDPLEKARRIYDYITLNMRYHFQSDYFVLDNIVDNCLLSNTGDCGIFALTFLTMCRCAGIPAGWQSGLTAEPDFCGAHDWTRFYIAPYGWLFADPSYGTAAVRAGNEQRRRFYFGNIDAFRMAANSAFQADFHVPMRFWRGDPYDNQLGEMEREDRAVTYGEYTRSKTVLECEEL